MSERSSPSKSEANHQHLAERGRRLIVFFTVAVIALQVSYLVGDPDRVPQNAVRMALTLWLCVAIYRGSNAARWITASLLFWPVLLRVAALMTPNEGDQAMWIQDVATIIIYSAFALVLVFSAGVNQYLQSRAAQPSSST